MEQFVSLIRQWIDRAIYVWGGQGEPTSEADIRLRETSTQNADRAIALYRKRQAQGVDPVIKFDCSGLIIWALQTMGLITYDTTADGLYRKSPSISKGDLQLGDFVFKLDSDGRAYHVGVVTRIVNGVPYITESKGRDYGVIETAIGTNWNRFGRNPFIAGGEKVLLKTGSQGDAVKVLQGKLNQLGYGLVVDGDFGAKTDAAVRDFQSKRGLTVDGIVGDKTWAALDEAIKPIDYKALYAEAAEKVAFLTAEIAAGQQLAAELRAQIAAKDSELAAVKPLAERFLAIKQALA